MRRALALLLLIVVLAPGTWLRSAVPPPVYALNLRFIPLPLPPAQERARLLGPFRLEAAWQMTSPHADFGGFSALLRHRDGEYLAISDRGFLLRFTPPGVPRPKSLPQPWLGSILPGPKWRLWDRDAESATSDPATGYVWIGWEGINTITRHGPDFAAWVKYAPPAMQDWPENLGPEAMVRLADGRFIVLCEAFTGWFHTDDHAALLFPDDPLERPRPAAFTFEGPAGFHPTDMAQLPDGRVLILMRRLVWPLPARFGGRIVLADPAEIRPGEVWHARELARIEPPLPIDNFEGIAIVPRTDGMLTVWVISDDNNADFQRTILWKLALDPATLPPPREKARGVSARPYTGPG